MSTGRVCGWLRSVVSACHSGVVWCSWLAVMALLSISQQSIAAVGRIEANATVSSSGAASYEIPLRLPPGPNGIEPRLSLLYSSQAGDGIVGPGWALSGLPAIARCNRTLAQDGAAAAVTLTYDDAFCLDGKRLRITSGSIANYGQAGSTYDTEIAEFSQITAFGTSGNGPSYFILKAKSGLIFEFGNSSDSRITPGPNQSTAYVWLLNKVRDRSGTSYAVSYGTGAAGSVGIGVPLSIAYAPISAGAGTYTHTVNFIYGPKVGQVPNTMDPAVVGFVAGLQVVNTNLLLRVEARISGTLSRKYTLGYEAAPTTTRARLATITECAGSAGTDCLSPTTVTYQNGAAGVSTPGVTAITGDKIYLASPDLNGDGRTDIVYADSAVSTVYALLATGSGVGSPMAIASYTGSSSLLVAFGDVAGSTRADLLVPQGGVFNRYSWNGSGFSAAATGVAVPANAIKAALTDIDADGRVDLVTVSQVFDSTLKRYTTTVLTRLNTSTGGSATFSGTQTTAYSSTFNCGTTPGICKFSVLTGTESRSGVQDLDFDGDGRKDLALYSQSASPDGAVILLRYLLSNGSTFTASVGSQESADVPAFALWNDDECTDIIALNSVLLSKCNSQPAAAISFNATPLTTLDWNGDGHTDVLVQNGSTFGVIQSAGNATVPLVATSIPVPAQPRNAFALDVDGDGLHDLGTWSSSGIIFYRHNSPGVPPDLATSFTDGYGIAFSPSYVSIAQSNYVKGADAVYPARDYQGPMYVVGSTTASTGLSGAAATFTTAFQYYRARFNVQGRGFEGFDARRSIDGRTNLQVYEYFHRAFPYTGRLKHVDVFQPNGSSVRIAQVDSTWAAHTYGTGTEIRKYPYLSSATQQRYEFGGVFNGVLLSTEVTNNIVSYDSGALTDSTTTLTEGSTANGVQAGQSHTLRTYVPVVFNDTANWCIGRPSSVQQINSHTLAGGTQLTRTSSITWDGVYCRPSQSAIEPGDPQWEVATSFGYDGFGNVTSVTVTPATGQGQSARASSIDWGADGRFPRTLTNAKSHMTQVGWNDDLGLRTSVTDPNGLTTTWSYDNFGRMTRQQLADGTATDVAITPCYSSGNCGATDLRLRVDVTERDTANNAVRVDSRLLDGLGRLRFSIARLLSGADSTSQLTYDAVGRVATQSAPYIAGIDPIFNTTFTYDLLGRVSQVERPTSEADPASHLTQFAYLGLTTSVTDALGRSTSRKFDVFEQVVQSIDALGNDTDFEYDAFGQLLKTRDVANNEIVLSYNVRGFKISSSDPDLGTWTYAYYPLGELKTQTTARSQTTQFTYDALSRPLTRVEVEGTTTFSYDVAAKGIGKPAAVSSPGYAESYLYDSAGRLSQQSIVADGITHVINQTYNTLGLLDSLTYPTSTAGVRFKLRYGYQNGQLQNVRDNTGDVLGATFWQANATNANGQLIDEQLGNGVRTFSTYDRVTGLLDTRTAGLGGGTSLQNLAYKWDKVGNLNQREDLRQSLIEAFHYDPLYRMDYSTLNGVQNLGLIYDAIGNITHKSDVGGTYVYHPVKKHAVVSAGSNTYTYDANGNAITRNGATLSWTSYNLPSFINSSDGNSSGFSYTHDRRLRKQVANYGGTQETTHYIAGLLEKVTLGSTDSWRHRIFAAGGEVAVYTRKSTGTNETHYLSKDHLGSTDVVTNAAGAVEVRESFAAFGQRRNAAGWTGNPTPADWTGITATTRHGFTGHTMLDNLNLTHMGGRVYDQITGRFLSPDPFVFEPFSGQGLNRYSYVSNNPLSFTDPSGFQTERCPSVVDCMKPFQPPPPPPPPPGDGEPRRELTDLDLPGNIVNPRLPGRPSRDVEGGPQGPTPAAPPTTGPSPRPVPGFQPRPLAGVSGGSAADGTFSVLNLIGISSAAAAEAPVARSSGPQRRVAPQRFLRSVVRFAEEQRDLAQAEVITDVEATARVSEFIARQPGISLDRFLNVFAAVLSGNSPDSASRLRAPLVPRFGQYGFAEEFIEKQYGLHRNNQVRHFVGHIIAGYDFGSFGGGLATFYREPGLGPDFDLGIVGVDIGDQLLNGDITFQELGGEIRRAVGVRNE